MKKLFLHRLSLILPFLVLLTWVLGLEWNLQKAKSLEVPIRGFDPRDLISGHYLLYEIDLAGKDPCQGRRENPRPHEDDSCVCWESQSNVGLVQWSGDCEDRPTSCELLLRGRCQGDRFRAGVERTYIPEADAKFLQTLPQGSKLVLKITEDGRGFVEELKPAGLPYQDWISQQKSNP